MGKCCLQSNNISNVVTLINNFFIYNGIFFIYISRMARRATLTGRGNTINNNNSISRFSPSLSSSPSPFFFSTSLTFRHFFSSLAREGCKCLYKGSFTSFNNYNNNKVNKYQRQSKRQRSTCKKIVFHFCCFRNENLQRITKSE